MPFILCCILHGYKVKDFFCVIDGKSSLSGKCHHMFLLIFCYHIKCLRLRGLKFVFVTSQLFWILSRRGLNHKDIFQTKKTSLCLRPNWKHLKKWYIYVKSAKSLKESVLDLNIFLQRMKIGVECCKIKMGVIWVVIDVCQRFRGTYCFYHQDYDGGRSIRDSTTQKTAYTFQDVNIKL